MRRRKQPERRMTNARFWRRHRDGRGGMTAYREFKGLSGRAFAVIDAAEDLHLLREVGRRTGRRLGELANRHVERLHASITHDSNSRPSHRHDMLALLLPIAVPVCVP
jgi:hypothetical protein